MDTTVNNAVSITKGTNIDAWHPYLSLNLNLNLNYKIVAVLQPLKVKEEDG